LHYLLEVETMDEHLLPFFVVLGAAASQRLRRIHASVTFGSLRMDAFEAD
jgi:aromatic ring-opening dioxygenase catalytic subunit (LigB family)